MCVSMYRCGVGVDVGVGVYQCKPLFIGSLGKLELGMWLCCVVCWLCSHLVCVGHMSMFQSNGCFIGHSGLHMACIRYVYVYGARCLLDVNAKC